MKLIDAITNVVIPDDAADWRYNVPLEEVCESLGIERIWDSTEEIDAKLKAYPIFNWLCTDEHVGLDALWFAGSPVGTILRTGRKMGYQIKWISKEKADQVRDFLLSQRERPTFDLLDPDEEIGDTAAVSYAGQALTQEGFYQGRPVTVLVWYDTYGSGMTTPLAYRQPGRAYTEHVPYGDPKANSALVQDGDEQRVIPIEEFRIALNVRKADDA